MAHEFIHIEGARQHNLKNLSLDIPRDQLVVVCGPSGSGKSTLAFDLVYAEGQRRYVESLSAYARQFLPKMDKPEVDLIEGLSPAISLEQQSSGKNPRSTVGTVTEIYDFLRVFYARLGQMRCPVCGKAIEARSIDEIIADILQLPEGTRFIVMAPLVEHQKGTHLDLLNKLKAEGFVRVRVNGAMTTINDMPKLEKNKKHSIDLVVDRLVMKEGLRTRLADSLELVLKHSDGRVIIHEPDKVKKGAKNPYEGDTVHSTSAVCRTCRISMPELSPQLFSFNSPQGACPRCAGLGMVEYFEPRLVAPNRGLALATKAIVPWANPKILARYEVALEELGKKYGFTLFTPLSEFSEEATNALFYGESEKESPKGKKGSLRRNRLGGSIIMDEGSPTFTSEALKRLEQISNNHAGLGEDGKWRGIIPLLEQGMRYNDAWRDLLSRYLQTTDCPECHGARLRKEALSVYVDDLPIDQFCAMPIGRLLKWIEERSFSGRQAVIAEPLVKELQYRLHFMVNVGLDYISLGRTMGTLSGGESQRIRLASQLGSGLVGVTYVLDEPSIGLHPRDNERLISTLRALQQRGNTVLVVEHDEATICEADTLIELGPGSGEHGGELVYMGHYADLIAKSSSLTAQYLRGDMSVPLPDERREAKEWLTLKGVSTNNLKGIDCAIPLGLLTCVSGVSGSGKSSLIIDTLYKHLALAQNIRVDHPGQIEGIEGIDKVERVVAIDQSPIGRTPRSNPATYTKIFDEIRQIFSMTQDAKKRGYAAGRFSFNVKGGRCEACSGDGVTRIEMHFLPDVTVCCEVCQGRRYNHETLEVRYRDKNIAEVLEMTVEEARVFFQAYPVLERRLSMLEDVGLSYIRLGQAATTLSGGEAQRIKISRELGKRSLPGTIYILDEPTTGLHMHEVGKLVTVLHHLVDKGATVVLIEHNTDVILASDYIIDLGPGGGEDGGSIIAEGSPEAIMVNPASITGTFLLEERKARRKRRLAKK